jgi:arginine/lysine/ornithine decarboxylase
MPRPDHSREPIVEAALAYHERDALTFLIPGHKQGRGLDPRTRRELGGDIYRFDMASQSGLDDRLARNGVLKEAQELAADAWGADQVMFLVNGSTSSLQVAISATVGPGDEILVARNLHKAAVSGLIISGATPVYVRQEVDDELELSHNPSAEAFARALEEHPDAKAALLVSPSLYGVTADVRGIADACHARGVPLLVDEAWGAHFAFHPELPPFSLAEGADLAICSIHKTLLGVRQSSIIATRGDRIDQQKLTDRANLLESTSVTSLVLCTVDASRRLMAQEGEALFTRVLALAQRAREGLAGVPGLQILGPSELTGRPGAVQLDPTKVLVDVAGLGMTGYEAADRLYGDHQLPMELQDHRRVLALVAIGDDERTVDRLVNAFHSLTAASGDGAQPRIVRTSELFTDSRMTPREAYFSQSEAVEASAAVGRICAEQVTPYPPGIPLLIAGERVTAPIVRYGQAVARLGGVIADAADSKLETIRVVTGA